jgi:hypothetical protein
MSWLGNLFGGKPTHEQFSRIVQKVLREKGIEGDLVYDAQKFSIDVMTSRGLAQTFMLGNAYDDYCRVPASERKNVLEGYLAPHAEVPATLNEAVTNVFPRVQMRSFFEQIALQSKIGLLPAGDHALMPRRPLAERFAISLVFDSPFQVAYLANSKLKEWSTTFDELLPRAITNLERITPEPFQRLSDGLYYSQYNDTHDATRLLLNHRVTECRVQGRTIAAIPNRNRLFISGEDDHVALTKMIEMIEQSLQQESRSMPVFPLVFNGATWELWKVPANHPLKEKFDYFEALGMNEEYGAQKELLEALHEKEGSEFFVATFVAYQHKDGGIMTCSTITKDVPTMLPKTEQVTFVRIEPSEVVATVPWEEAAQLLGERLKPVGLYPERYFVEQFPTDAECVRLKQAEVSVPSP